MTKKSFMNQTRIAFIGAGNMATSLVGGLIAKGMKTNRIYMSDPSQEQLDIADDKFKVHVTLDNEEAIRHADVVILAVKPQVLGDVTQSVAPVIREAKPLVISIAAGVTINSLQNWLGEDTALVRCMPNTPSLVQAGATGLFANDRVSAAQKEVARAIMSAVGIALWVDDESQLDAVTAVSGSGPAYFFLMMEAMADAGESLGLPPEMAKALTLQTALGASQMAITSDVPPSELRRRVTSPGGTTEQAIQSLEQGGIRQLFQQALASAKKRAQELSGTD